jgi:hypothetical protein
LDLFEARRKKSHNGNPLKFIERRTYFLYFYFLLRSIIKKKEQQVLSKQSISAHIDMNVAQEERKSASSICVNIR